ncbi:hypothetical protein [Bordetella trematum]|uniref:hypothetical protein n=1 Tax=Bordetella trematum TaxID=123899 RepID=UPI003AF3E5C5
MQSRIARWRRAWMAAMMAATLAITGCASTGSSMLGGAQVDPRLDAGNDAEFFSRSGFQACAGAAALGVAACLLTAPSNKKAMCAIIAGVAACGVAMGTNYYLDYRRSQYKTTGEMLDAMTQDVEQDTQKLQQRSQTIQAVIDSDKQKLAQLNAEVKTGRMQEEAARKQLRNIDANIARIKKSRPTSTTRSRPIARCRPPPPAAARPRSRSSTPRSRKCRSRRPSCATPWAC